MHAGVMPAHSVKVVVGPDRLLKRSSGSGNLGTGHSNLVALPSRPCPVAEAQGLLKRGAGVEGSDDDQGKRKCEQLNAEARRKPPVRG